MSKAQVLVSRLEFVKPNGKSKWMARCPAHSDKSPSLSITELDDGRVLVHCHAGCGAQDVMAAVGLAMSDLFPDDGHYRSIGPRRRKTPSEDEFLLMICRESRKRGERLTEAEKRAEREAWIRTRRLA